MVKEKLQDWLVSLLMRGYTIKLGTGGTWRVYAPGDSVAMYRFHKR